MRSSNFQQLLTRLVFWFVMLQMATLIFLVALLGQQQRGKNEMLGSHFRSRRLQNPNKWAPDICYWGIHYYCWTQDNDGSGYYNDYSSYGAVGNDDDGKWSHYDDVVHGTDDDGSLTDDGTDDYHQDDQYWLDDYYPAYDDDASHHDDGYTYSYQPVPSTSVIQTHGGYGSRRGRTLAQIRFNKCPPVVDEYATSAWKYSPSLDYIQGVHRSIFPLMPADYPVHGQKAIVLKRETRADSVMTANDYQLHGATAYQFGSKLSSPLFPGSDPNNEFWGELRHVIEVQYARRNNKDPSSLNRWPDLWEGNDLDTIATLVHGEYPASLQQSFLQTLFKEGVELNYDIMPFRSVVDFVGLEVRMAAINTWIVDAVAPITFLLKWHSGVPRPEEVAWLIYSGAFTKKDGVPVDIVQSIRSMQLEHAAEFTAYEMGSPTHPSWPAMHAAKSTCSVWLPVVVKLTPEQYCEALRMDYAVAYARTVAGVHYPMDNFAGLNLGSLVVIDKLPAMFSEHYGCDPSAVLARLERLQFDWHEFDPYECTIGGVSAGQWLRR